MEVRAQEQTRGELRMWACWVISAVWLAVFLGSLAAGWRMGVASVAPLLLLLLALIHCSLLYGILGVSVYAAIGVGVGFGFEASSIANGFPFGSYVHNTPGPRLLGVSIPAIFVYTVYCWFAWMVARAIVMGGAQRIEGWNRFVVPVIAAFVLAGFDYPFDPIGATIQGRWTYAHPGGQFGVPLSNFLGWMLAGWAICQPLALLESRFRKSTASGHRRYWMLPCLVWMATAIQYPVYWASAPDGVTTLGTRTFVTADIYEASFAASLFTLVLAGLLGLVRLFQGDSVDADNR